MLTSRGRSPDDDPAADFAAVGDRDAPDHESKPGFVFARRPRFSGRRAGLRPSATRAGWRCDRRSAPSTSTGEAAETSSATAWSRPPSARPSRLAWTLHRRPRPKGQKKTSTTTWARPISPRARAAENLAPDRHNSRTGRPIAPDDRRARSSRAGCPAPPQVTARRRRRRPRRKPGPDHTAKGCAVDPPITGQSSIDGGTYGRPGSRPPGSPRVRSRPCGPSTARQRKARRPDRRRGRTTARTEPVGGTPSAKAGRLRDHLITLNALRTSRLSA